MREREQASQRESELEREIKKECKKETDREINTERGERLCAVIHVKKCKYMYFYDIYHVHCSFFVLPWEIFSFSFDCFKSGINVSTILTS